MRWLLPLFCVLAFAGCRDSAYSTASKKNTAQGFRDFIRDFPQDPNVDAAKDQLAELEFKEARKVHSPLAYKRFLAEFPNAFDAPQARQLLESLRFNAAQTRQSSDAWRQFLKDHPEGNHRDEALEALRRAELKELAQLDDVQALRSVASAHADDARGQQAAERLDDKVFAEARTAAALYGYLREFPAGAHRDEARVALLDLKLEGLLVSLELAEAKALIARSPLASKVQRLDARVKTAEQLLQVRDSKDEPVRRALPDYDLRSLQDLVNSLAAHDPMDRWQAAQELGQLRTVKAIDPLIEAFRTGRNPLIRVTAFESLALLLAGLPRAVAEYEVATRIETARENSGDAQMVLSLAMLYDLSGQLERAAAEYQRGFDVANPDPVVLRRWAQIRADRGQMFSAAVAARQLAVWAKDHANVETMEQGSSALAAARNLCAVVELSREADQLVGRAVATKTEFSDDVREFKRQSAEALKLAEAKLRDAELKLLESDGRARRCGDPSIAERLAAGEARRATALAELKTKKHPKLGLLRELVPRIEPSDKVKAVAVAP